MTEWDGSLKRTFNDKSSGPFTIDLFGVDDDLANGIEDNTITLKKYVLSRSDIGLLLCLIAYSLQDGPEGYL